MCSTTWIFVIPHTIVASSLTAGSKVEFAGIDNEGEGTVELVDHGVPIAETHVRICFNGDITRECVVGHIEVSGPTVTPGYATINSDAAVQGEVY